MPIDTVNTFTNTLRRCRLLEPVQAEELARDLQPRFPQPRALAQELVRRGWLTPYQVEQLFQGKEAELLLGSYVVLDRLGEGGMGTVFKARNWKLGQTVALKTIRKERLATADAQRRFQREIRVAAQLDHPHIVRALDADEVGGQHLFVMEYVEGIDLARLIKRHGPPPLALACQYVRQAALGLQHAFERGLVHRDIKPANLLLTNRPDAAGGRVVKVLDMGLARFTSTDEDDGDSSSTLTQEGAVMGTPDYMAPEQARESRAVDIRADLYSLGCTLYFLLTGRVPFPGGSTMEKLLKHQVDEPTPVERLRPEVPDSVRAVVSRLMAKRPEDRFQTPAELAAHLQALLADGVQPKAKARPIRQKPEQTEEMGTDAFWAGVVEEEPPTPPAAPVALLWGILAVVGVVLAVGAVVLALALGGRGTKREPAPPSPPGVTGPPSRPPEESPDPPGFVRLFNGKDLSGWKHLNGSKADDWTIEDGVLVNLARSGAAGHLETVGKYHDFVLRFEVRVAPKTFGGINVRGLKMDIIDSPKGSPKGESGTVRSLGGTKEFFWLKARPGAFRGPGQWNEFEVARQGDRVAVTLNGQLVNEQKVSAGQGRAKPIEIPQFNQRAEFRNLWIKPLVEDVAAKPPDPGVPTAVEILTSPDWEWTEPVNLGPTINGPSRDHEAALTADGLYLMYQSNRGGQKWLYEARRKSVDEPFGDVRRLAELGGGEDGIQQPFLSADGLTVVFSSNQAGGQGLFDVWMSRRANRDAAWGKPENLGAKVNKEGDDEFPALSADGRTLYFDRRHPSWKRDLYCARRGGIDQPWGKVEVLGPAINTIEFERCPRPLADGTSLVFVRWQAASAPIEWLLAIPSGDGWEVQSILSREMYFHPCFTADGRTVIFEAQLPGGLGLTDLWQMRRVPKAKPADPNRKAADALRPLGAILTLRQPNGATFAYMPADPLPDGPFALTRIEFSDGKFPKGFFGDVLIPAIADLPELEEIYDRQFRLYASQEELDRLADTSAAKQLVRLQCGLKYSPDAIRTLKRLPKLSKVAGYANQMDDGLLEQLATDLPQLTSLSLSDIGNQPTRRGWEAVARLPLTTLGLSGVQQSDPDTFRVIAGMPKLVYLSAWYGKGIGDDAVRELAGSKSLAKLYIYGTSVSDAGLESLCGLATLVEVSVQGTEVTADGVYAFHQARPDCKISWDGGTIAPTVKPKTVPER